MTRLSQKVVKTNLTTGDIAKVLGMSPQSVCNWLDSAPPIIPSRRFIKGGRRVVEFKDFYEFLVSRKAPAEVIAGFCTSYGYKPQA